MWCMGVDGRGRRNRRNRPRGHFGARRAIAGWSEVAYSRRWRPAGTSRRAETRPAIGRLSIMPRYTLETIVIVLLILWLLGWLVVPVAGNLVHLLLVVILVVVVIRVLQGRRPLA